MRYLRTNTACRVTVGPFYDKTDGVTPETSLTVTNCKLTLMVDDGNVPTLVLDAAATASGGSNDMVHVTNDDAGFYDLELAAANVNYLGRAVLAITDAANHCPVFHEFMILPAVVYDSLVLGTDNLQVDAVQQGGTTLTARDIGASVLLSVGTGAGQVNLSSGKVPATIAAADVTGNVPADVIAISGDTTAADNCELQFDGTGLSGGTFPSTQAQVSAIGSGTGAALNFAADADNASAPIKTVTAVGTQTNTYANTANDNGTYHVITNATNNIDWVYGFSVGSGRSATKAVFVGYLAASAPQTSKTITVSAYNFGGSSWDTVKTITGQAGTTDVTVDIALLSVHTGTGAEAGKVYIRFTATGQTGAVLNTDQLIIQAQNLGQTVGYANGSIWVKATGTSGTTPYVHGTADNPCPWASAKTLNTTLGLNRYVVTPGTTVTLDAALAGAVMTGRSYALALGGQNISGSYFEGVEGLSGTGTCATGEAIIVDCHLGAITIGEADFVRCHLMGTITMSQASVPMRFHDCSGISSAKITFNGANQTTVVSQLSGVLTIAGMVATNTLYLDGNGDVTLDATNTAGTVYVAGNIRLTNNGSGQTIHKDALWSTSQPVGSVTAGVTLADGAHGGSAATITAKSISVVNSDAGGVAVSFEGSGSGNSHALKLQSTNGKALAAGSTNSDAVSIDSAAASGMVVNGATGDIVGDITGTVGLNAAALADIATEISDALRTDTIPELAQGQPPATPTVVQAVMMLYMAMRNELTTDASSKKVRNNAGTVVFKKALSDNGTVYTEEKAVTGP